MVFSMRFSLVSALLALLIQKTYCSLPELLSFSKNAFASLLAFKAATKAFMLKPTAKGLSEVQSAIDTAVKKNVLEKNTAARRKAQYAKIAKEAGVKLEVKQFVRGNSAITEIEMLVSERQVSLVVIGLRVRSRVGKLLLGSVAQDILLSVPCPVLAVKAA